MRTPARIHRFLDRTDPNLVAATETGGILPLLSLSSQGHLDLCVGATKTLSTVLLEPTEDPTLTASLRVPLPFFQLKGTENGNRCNAPTRIRKTQLIPVRCVSSTGLIVGASRFRNSKGGKESRTSNTRRTRAPKCGEFSQLRGEL